MYAFDAFNTVTKVLSQYFFEKNNVQILSFLYKRCRIKGFFKNIKIRMKTYKV